MSIHFVCETCGISKRVNDRFAGSRVRCPGCDSVVRIPEIDRPDDTSPAVKQPVAIQAEATRDGIQPQATTRSVPVEAIAVEKNHVSDQDIHVAQAVLVDGDASAAVPVDVVTQPARTTVSGSAKTRPHHSDHDDDHQESHAHKSEEPESEMDMTAMVDVTFLLLIFFMVTAAFSSQKSIQMPRQQSDAPSQSSSQPMDQNETVEIEVDENGAFLVLTPEWERETPSKLTLISFLREANAGKSEAMKLSVKVHERAKVRSMVEAMDAGTIAEYSPIQVVQVDGFD
jgi:biopolymer transport protein ExbD